MTFLSGKKKSGMKVRTWIFIVWTIIVDFQKNGKNRKMEINRKKKIHNLVIRTHGYSADRDTNGEFRISVRTKSPWVHDDEIISYNIKYRWMELMNNKGTYQSVVFLIIAPTVVLTLKLMFFLPKWFNKKFKLNMFFLVVDERRWTVVSESVIKNNRDLMHTKQ